MSENLVSTYPDPPDTVYVIPITASQEIRPPSPGTLEELEGEQENYPEPPPEGTVYFIPITEEPEDDMSGDVGEKNTKDEEPEEEEENAENDENDEISYPDAPGAYYIIPITNKNIVRPQPQPQYWPSYYYPPYYPPAASYYPPAPCYAYNPAPFYINDPRMPYGYNPGYLAGANSNTAAPTNSAPVEDNSVPKYLRTTSYTSGMCGIPYNSAPNEPAGPSSYISRRQSEKSSQLFEDMFSRADKSMLSFFHHSQFC